MLAGEKELKDLDQTIDICLVGIHGVKGFLEGVSYLDACERLGNALIDAMKCPSDDGRV